MVALGRRRGACFGFGFRGTTLALGSDVCLDAMRGWDSASFSSDFNFPSKMKGMGAVVVWAAWPVMLMGQPTGSGLVALHGLHVPVAALHLFFFFGIKYFMLRRR
jgi:hypothetical protein